MQTSAAILYSIGILADLGGIILVVIEFRSSLTHFREWKNANLEHHEGTTYGQVPLLDKIVQALLGNPLRRVASVALLVIGVVAGTLGNFLSLYS